MPDTEEETTIYAKMLLPQDHLYAVTTDGQKLYMLTTIDAEAHVRRGDELSELTVEEAVAWVRGLI